jgi:hypothetical protein
MTSIVTVPSIKPLPVGVPGHTYSRYYIKFIGQYNGLDHNLSFTLSTFNSWTIAHLMRDNTTGWTCYDTDHMRLM